MSFRWSVLLLNCSTPMHRLLQMKRSFETNRRTKNLVEVTFYDEYARVIRDYVRLKSTRKKEPTAAEIAEAYDGNQHSSKDYVCQRVRTATRLGETVVSAM